MARSADDLELLRAALDGEPWRPLPETAPRLAWSRTREWPLMQHGGAAAFEAGIARLAQAGVLAREWWPPDPLGGLFEAQKTIMAHEAAQHLATLLVQHGPHLSAPLRQLLEHGTGLGAAEVAAAQALARQGREVLDALLGEVDALVVPASPGEAPAGLQATGDPAFSRVWNLLGHPCANVPGLLGPQGLPVGLQLVGRRGAAGERALLAAARTVGEIIHGMISGHERRPTISRPAGP
jgi:Asp-tRNA(Asn)/Glu-tRNA(Gln) amidotransferase A subunit family amidase